MGKGRTNKIDASIHKKFILDCIEKGMIGAEISRALKQKGASISVPTINKFIKEVKKSGISASQFKEKSESAALAINEKLQKVPELSSILGRRNYLVDNLLERRKKVLDFANEGKRSKAVYASTARLLEMLEKARKTLKPEDYLALDTEIKFLNNYVKAHFLPDEIFPQLEDTLRKYTMDIHEICKYVEQWTSKYEIEALLEKLTEMITKAAVTTFGPLLKTKLEEERQYYIDTFIKEVEKAVAEVKEYEINLQEKKNG